MQLWNGYQDEEEFSIIIENFGIGPAFIKSVRTHYKDSIYQNFDYPRMYEILKSDKEYGDYMEVFSSLMEGMVIPSNKQIIHMKIVRDDRPDLWDDLFLSDKIELEIEYASIYDERWVVRGLFNAPVKTKGTD